jgi:ATP-binding cassette, subfamily C (CFTR/MRP), member 4
MRAATQTDHRVRAMSEVLRGIQAIKMYVWERWFRHLVTDIRRREIAALRGTARIAAALLTFHVIPRISIFLSLASFALLSPDPITARQVFMLTALFNTIHNSMVNFWPLAVSSVAEGFVSVKRIQSFLLIENIDSKSIGHTQMDGIENRKERCCPGGQSVVTIRMNNITAVWRNNDTATRSNVESQVEEARESGVHDVSWEANVGLWFLIGPVGAGKSTLLSVLLGELPLKSGQLTVTGKVSYSAQEVWLFRGTVRENIVFMEEFDEKRYAVVTRACALDKDFMVMPNGDQTMVSEQGISLSGGQKARINLARAVYREADIYLLDDPLSAVDVKVGKHIFQKCIRELLKVKIIQRNSSFGTRYAQFF